uniref:Anaphase-promoting complex subunit 2 TPR repeats domain-containing protein n=1 Tax=Parascaris univalens TaxID=6257 RepID=A0A915B0F9_PARUN
EEMRDELQSEFCCIAGQIFFSPELIFEAIEVFSRILKFGFVLFESTEDCERDATFQRRALLLERISACVHMIIQRDHFNVGSKVCKDAVRIASMDIVVELARRACTQPTEQPLLSTLEERLNGLKKWSARLCIAQELYPLHNDLKVCLEKSVVDFLTKQIFDLVVVRYPESGDIIDDLRHCMQNNAGYGRKKLVETLASEVKRRLLHIGYASAVDCLRRLDPTCVIMQHICSIIRTYVKRRPDTVRSIITYITGEKREELSEQLTKKHAAIVDEEDMIGVNDELICDEDGDQNWREWQPDPPDAIPGQSRRFRQNADVFNVGFYLWQQRFIRQEYRQLLAERLTNHGTEIHISSYATWNC